ncbi:MAG: enoyl-CoA hydratase/isomerase family protein [Actinomycetes bacterium]
MDISVENIGDVALVRWNDGQNRINLDSIDRLRTIFRELAEREGQLAVVWTGADKFFSNGLDLDRFGNNPEEMGETLIQLDRLFGQLIVFPGYLIAALNGHSFAGGAMLSLTADYRIMRSDRGYWCLNEVDINMFLPPNMADVVLARMPKNSALEAMNTARRYSAAEAKEAGIVEAIAEGDDVLAKALEYAAMIALKNRRGIATHKEYIFGDLARQLQA